MAAPRTVAVFGASGYQGGSVAMAFLKDGSFKVRAITRNPRKKAIQELKHLGAEIVKADLDNEKSLLEALKDVYGVFLVTDYWEYMDKDREFQQGKRVADICSQFDVKHIVFSGLENVKKLTDGKLDVPHFDGKGEIEEYFREIGARMTSVRMPDYFENFLHVFRPVKSGKEYYVLDIPMGGVPMDGMSVKDLGGVVLAIFKSPEKYIGKEIGLSTDKLKIEEYAAIMSRHTGKSIQDSKISVKEYEERNFPGAQELAKMFQFYMKQPDRNKDLTLMLNPEAQSFEEWMSQNKNAFLND
ncbi:nmrA-like family domain-containing protein 1 [Hemiscyllium ocellatum]|uniref:nmrA-like family domain-containing protein 1 n=1 Tax=Hemiscyllium ocellatum TaxID=170820 RepID=UPI0029665BBC|nr:nmrA-like family domain-containing protein 1 [Hemiscyllium ocellatum]